MKEQIPEPRDYLDSKNFKIWEQVNWNFNVTLKYTDADHYSVYSKNSDVTIFIPYEKVNKASFTHELLHPYMQSQNLYPFGLLKISMREDPILSKIMSEALVDHIGNCLDHQRMFPVYIELGYSAEMFLEDFNKKKVSEGDIRALKLYWHQNLAMWRLAVDSYIGHYFSIKGCMNCKVDHSKQLNELKLLSPDLFEILESFWHPWISFDYKKKTLPLADYLNFITEFADKLKHWTVNEEAGR